ncbi:MAG: hypothetical protein US53_C0014G0007 [Candidatus Woesebacteria bacterium GW2011_GWA1_37_7]|uniref:Uncharacterized protein n=1 Tax=Candidatus Woesebacteria bacterium GW2011_GWA1_37_7 TaxID=1618545 RepID=A0A0G0H682_9BACT|nr:MAG: hypothetical protein US53_C0014G0007 [Candidatus Woesebacteria bacterium GW2011_GWA1_37_7]
MEFKGRPLMDPGPSKEPAYIRIKKEVAEWFRIPVRKEKGGSPMVPGNIQGVKRGGRNKSPNA